MPRIRNNSVSGIDLSSEKGSVIPLAMSLSASGAGNVWIVQGYERIVFQAVGTTSAGTFSCVTILKASLDGTNFVPLATITLNGATGVTDGFVSTAPWPIYKNSLSSIGGTNAVLNVRAAV